MLFCSANVGFWGGDQRKLNEEEEEEEAGEHINKARTMCMMYDNSIGASRDLVLKYLQDDG